MPPKRSTLLAHCADRDPHRFFEIAGFLGSIRGDYLERATDEKIARIDEDVFVGDWIWELQSDDAPVRVHIAAGTRLEDAVRLLDKMTRALRQHSHVLERES